MDRLNHNLRIMWDNKLYPTFRYPLFFSIFDLTDPFGDIGYIGNNLATISFNDQLRINQLNKILNLYYKIGNGNKKQEYTNALKLILVPTLYLTPNGNKVINFDVDIYQQILIAFYDFNEEMGKEFADICNIIRSALYLVNFS